MNAMDSPIESLSLNYLSYDALTVIVNNLWTLIAVLTGAGAVSVAWRIKAATSFSPPKPDPICFCDLNSSEIASPSPSQTDAALVKSASTPAESADGVTRGKVFVYYYEDNQEIENVCDGGDGYNEAEDDGCELDGAKGFRWRERIGEWEMGWYRYQDLTVFDGNVVKLWESKR